jgi:hypothetical protein
LIIDEAHHVLPADWESAEEVVPRNFGSLVMIGLNPGKQSVAALKLVNIVCVVGEQPARTLREFCKLVGEAEPAAPRRDLEKGEAVVWIRGQRRTQLIQSEPSRGDRKRHRRKYAERNDRLSASESRAAVRRAIEEQFAPPA